MTVFGSPTGVPEDDDLGGGLGSSAYGGGYNVAADIGARLTLGSYIDGVIAEREPVHAYIVSNAVQGSVPAFIHTLGFETLKRGCFIYGQEQTPSGSPCDDFSTDPQIKVTNPAPQYQVQTWDSANQRINFEMRRENSVTITNAGHYWSSKLPYRGTEPKFSMNWTVTRSDYETYAATGRVRYGNDEAPKGIDGVVGKPHIQMLYTWDSDHGAGKAIRGEFWDGNTTAVTGWFVITVGTTHSVEIFIDAARGLGVLKVDGTERSTVALNHTYFEGLYNEFVIPQGHATDGNGSSTDSYALGYIDNLCGKSGIVFTALHTQQHSYITGPPLIYAFQPLWLCTYYTLENINIGCYLQGSPEGRPSPNDLGEGYGDTVLLGEVGSSGLIRTIDPWRTLDGEGDGSHSTGLAKTIDPWHALNGEGGGTPARGIRRVQKFLGIYMYGNAEGVTGVQGFQGAYIRIGEPASAIKNAYICTPEPISDSHSAFISGHDVITDSQNAFVFSTVDSAVTKRGYVAGLAKEHFSQPAYVHIATPTDSSQHGYVHSATPVEDAVDVYLKGAGNTRSTQLAYFQGLQSDRFQTSLFIQIETPVLLSKAAFVNGPPAVDSQSAFTFGMYIARVSSRAFIQIETPMFKAKSSYIRGHIELPVPKKPAYMDSHFAQTVFKGAFVQIITPMQEQQLSYVSGPLSLVTNKRAFIDGINQEETTQNIYTFGHYVTPPSAVSAYVHIEEFVWKSQPSFIKVGEPLPSDKKCWINGLESIHANAVGLYIDSRELLAGSKPAFIQIQNPMRSPAQRAFVQIETPLNAGLKRAYIRNVGDLRQPLNAYTLGGFRQNTSKQAYIQIHTEQPVIPKLCYIENVTFAAKSLGCYIFETGIDNYTQICYLNGYWEGAVDVTKGAYIGGHNSVNYIGTENTIDGEQPDRSCYINGVIRSLLDNQKAFVVNYGLIGDWELDDGNGDAGTAHADDTSTVDNDGNLKNWPTWVGGPHGEDC